mmetsp:Transcript_20105/g.30231  ORF Transcript_20105/g.30231 Transcript_20105/m.30231 type:complete len:190 (+) Transcript_20105:3237-3806(+)
MNDKVNDKVNDDNMNDNKVNDKVEETENVCLISKEGKSFQIPADVAKMSELVKSMMEDDDDTSEFPLPNVTSVVLERVIEYCRYHSQEEPMAEIPKPLGKDVKMADVVSEWYANFTEQLEQVELFELILAANYMDIAPLMNLACATVANMIEGMTVDEIRTTFNITNDFSPEEGAQIREENKWAEEESS